MKLNSDKKELQQGSQFNQISSKCTWQGYMDEDRTFYSVSENAILGGGDV